MSFSVAWDETSPSGNQDISLGDDRIREFKTQMRERVSVDHHFPAADDANTGYHEKATFIAQASDPLQVASALILYTKAVAGKAEIFSQHESSVFQQLTLNGQLWIPALGIASAARGDLIFRDASIFNRLPAGSAGQFLQTGGAGADPSWASIAIAATVAEMKAATSLIAFVSPGRTQNHPGVAKAWCSFDGTLVGTNAPTTGYNVTSVTRNSLGDYTVNFTTPFSSASYSPTGMARKSNLNLACCNHDTLLSGSHHFNVRDADGNLLDSNITTMIYFGDQ